MQVGRQQPHPAPAENPLVGHAERSCGTPRAIP